ncbi:hypothetical protein PVK06_030134 [Gossypium arboreum]|uniref:Uncharacterized protein n=1 Tax=Gossypium arboreum TaxID=29729 RepID=A0ABR0NMG6_GOSAR|nr:hypothetical protein PVK06_030134 [Gossypium arboreum]
MEKGFLDRVEDNAAIRIWVERTQQEKGDSLTEGYESVLWDFSRISVTQNDIQELKIKVDNPYSRTTNVPTFVKKLMTITGMREQWVAAQIKQKGDSKCIPYKSLRELILAHPDMKKKVDVFTLSIYDLVVFPKALGHVDEVVLDLFDRLDKKPLLEGRKVSYQVFSKNYSPLKELVATPRRDDIFEEKWIVILQNLQVKDIEWRAPWVIPDKILYRCGDFD